MYFLPRDHIYYNPFHKLKVVIVVVVLYLGWTLPGSPFLGWEDCVLQPLGATWALQFRLRQASVCRSHMRAGYLPVSGPLDFRLVIQVLLSPRMILNACVRRLHPCLTSLAEDVALPRVVHPIHAWTFSLIIYIFKICLKWIKSICSME